jgi:hypothetical protein
MRDSRLAESNFRQLLHYDGGPPVARPRFPDPLQCSGYCIDCEEKDLVAKSEGKLDLMSHGCDSADFEEVLGPMPRDGAGVQQPILFLLEKPGADYGSGQKVRFSGYKKSPPVNHYYWTPTNKTKSWPQQISEFEGNFYGPYFAYLMRRHRLCNVYITNLTKCRWRDGNKNATPIDILENCITLYLNKEISFFEPKLVFCFGLNAEHGFKSRGLGISNHLLYHPGAIRDRYRALGKTQEELVEQNDKRIQDALANIVA